MQAASNNALLSYLLYKSILVEEGGAITCSFFYASRHPTISKSVVFLISSHQVRLKRLFLQQCDEISPRPTTLVSNLSPSLKSFCLCIISPSPLYCPFIFPSSSRCRGRIPVNSIRYFKMITAVDPSPLATAYNLRPRQWRQLWSTTRIPLIANSVQNPPSITAYLAITRLRNVPSVVLPQ
ncbi:hypothetical protein G6F42_010060 [Rhizopus arrhizus]|nr:hypothetical protein G6F42_010060 [Rhizopus arrhizus]